jgi:hypothetical protein
MRGTPGPESVRKTEEVHFINGVKDCRQSVLDDFVLQGDNAQGPHPSIRFGDICPFGGLCTICPAMNSLMQVAHPFPQSFLVVFPCHTVNSGSSVLFKRVEARPKQFYGDMME